MINTTMANTGLISLLAMRCHRAKKAFGNRATMPAKISREIPLPRPRFVICSPIQTRNMDPVVTVTMAMKVYMPSLIIRAPGMPFAQAITDMDCTIQTATAPIRVHRAIFLRPPSSSAIFFSLGKTTMRSCRMICVEM